MTAPGGLPVESLVPEWGLWTGPERPGDRELRAVLAASGLAVPDGRAVVSVPVPALASALGCDQMGALAALDRLVSDGRLGRAGSGRFVVEPGVALSAPSLARLSRRASRQQGPRAKAGADPDSEVPVIDGLRVTYVPERGPGAEEALERATAGGMGLSFGLWPASWRARALSPAPAEEVEALGALAGGCPWTVSGAGAFVDVSFADLGRVLGVTAGEARRRVRALHRRGWAEPVAGIWSDARIMSRELLFPGAVLLPEEREAMARAVAARLPDRPEAAGNPLGADLPAAWGVFRESGAGWPARELFWAVMTQGRLSLEGGGLWSHVPMGRLRSAAGLSRGAYGHAMAELVDMGWVSDEGAEGLDLYLQVFPGHGLTGPERAALEDALADGRAQAAPAAVGADPSPAREGTMEAETLASVIEALEAAGAAGAQGTEPEGAEDAAEAQAPGPLRPVFLPGWAPNSWRGLLRALWDDDPAAASVVEAMAGAAVPSAWRQGPVVLVSRSRYEAAGAGPLEDGMARLLAAGALEDVADGLALFPGAPVTGADGKRFHAALAEREQAAARQRARQADGDGRDTGAAGSPAPEALTLPQRASRTCPAASRWATESQSYRVDAGLLAALLDSDPFDAPVSALGRLPFRRLFLSLAFSTKDGDWDGALVEAGPGALSLWPVRDGDGEPEVGPEERLPWDGTLDGLRGGLAGWEGPLLALFYMASQGADVEVAYRPSGGTSGPRPGRRAPCVWDVGVRAGAKVSSLEAERSRSGAAGSGGRVRCHWRRGHWAHYWCGSGEGRHTELRWLAPMLVGDRSDGSPETEHEVEK